MIKKLVNKVITKLEDIASSIMSKIGEDKFWKYFLIIFLIISLIPVFMPGIFWGHDTHFHLSRINGIVEGLRNGVFPVLIYPGYFSGYGYGNGIFYPDIFLYIPAVLNVLGLSTITAYKILLVILTIGILWSMYFCIKKITNSSYTATIVSVIYLMSSYRMTDMWIRAALGETITFVFFPFVILGLYELIYGNEKNWKYYTIGLIGVVLSHIISGVFCIILTLVFALFNIKKLFKEKVRIKYALLAGFLAIGISAFFTFPLLEAMLSDTFKYTTYQLKDPIYKHSVNPLLSFLDVPTGIFPWVPQGIGLVFIYLIVKFYKKNGKDEKQENFKKLCIIFALVLLYVSTSLFPWKLLGKYLSIIQFPWRLYILITLLLLFGFAVPITNFIKSKKDKIHFTLILTIFICFTFSVSFLYLLRFGLIKDYSHYVVISAEYVPVDVDYKEFSNRGEIITSNNDVSVNFKKKGTEIKIEYKDNTKNDTYLELPLLYYKGYVAKEENKDLKIKKGNNGVVRVYLDSSEGKIDVYYGITNIRKIGFICSIASLLVFVILCNRGRNKKES